MIPSQKTEICCGFLVQLTSHYYTIPIKITVETKYITDYPQENVSSFHALLLENMCKYLKSTGIIEINEAPEETLAKAKEHQISC